jgi:hypothetical protein
MLQVKNKINQRCRLNSKDSIKANRLTQELGWLGRLGRLGKAWMA